MRIILGANKCDGETTETTMWCYIKNLEKFCTLVKLKERCLNILLCDHLISFTYKPIFFHLLLLHRAIEWKRQQKNPTIGVKFEALACNNIAQQRLLIWEPYWNLKWNIRRGRSSHETLRTLLTNSILVMRPFMLSTYLISPINQLWMTEDF